MCVCWSSPGKVWHIRSVQTKYNTILCNKFNLVKDYSISSVGSILNFRHWGHLIQSLCYVYIDAIFNLSVKSMVQLSHFPKYQTISLMSQVRPVLRLNKTITSHSPRLSNVIYANILFKYHIQYADCKVINLKHCDTISKNTTQVPSSLATCMFTYVNAISLDLCGYFYCE